MKAPGKSYTYEVARNWTQLRGKISRRRFDEFILAAEERVWKQAAKPLRRSFLKSSSEKQVRMRRVPDSRCNHGNVVF